MKKTLFFAMMLGMTMLGTTHLQNGISAATPTGNTPPTVYMTKEISPEALVKIYKALGREATGRVAVKISTGEGGNTHYLKPTLIRQHGTYIVDYAEKIGLGTKNYQLVEIDK